MIKSELVFRVQGKRMTYSQIKEGDFKPNNHLAQWVSGNSSISFSLENIQQSHLPFTIQPVSSAWRFEMQINPLLNSDSTVVFVGDDGRLGNVNLTSGLSQRMNGNLSLVSIIFLSFLSITITSRGRENSFAFEKLSMACMFRGEKLEFRLFCLEVYPIDKKLKVC